MENRVAAWTLVGVVVAFKAWFVLLILLAQPDLQAVNMMLALHWPFFLLPILILAGPAIFWFRLLRARAKRRRLQWEEWHVEDHPQPVKRSS